MSCVYIRTKDLLLVDLPLAMVGGVMRASTLSTELRQIAYDVAKWRGSAVILVER